MVVSYVECQLVVVPGDSVVVCVVVFWLQCSHVVVVVEVVGVVVVVIAVPMWFVAVA